MLEDADTHDDINKESAEQSKKFLEALVKEEI